MMTLTGLKICMQHPPPQPMMVASEKVAFMLQNSTKSRHITCTQCHDLLTGVLIFILLK